MPITPSSIGNAYRRHDVYTKQKRQAGKEKLNRRLATKQEESQGAEGAEKKKVSTDLQRRSFTLRSGVWNKVAQELLSS